MAPTSDRELRVLKRTFGKVREEIEELLQGRIDSEVFAQIVVLSEGNLKQVVEQYDAAAHKLYMSVDEESDVEMELEAKIVHDQGEVRKCYALLQAQIRKAEVALKGKELRKSLVPAASSTLMDSTRSDQPKLKNIELPQFDGDLSKFYNFKALFINLVHNNAEFNGVQKLYYLKEALKGKASIVLQDCELDAYDDAWEYFLKRYENKRAIVRTFFVRLSELKPIKSESGIREMLDQTMAIIRGLKVAGEHVDDTFSRYIAFVVASKLDASTAKDWDNHSCSGSKYPKFDALFEFLQNRSFVMEERKLEKAKEAKDISKPLDSSKFVQKKSFVIAASQKNCQLCGSKHFLNQCDQFKALNAHRRYDFVKGNHLCMVCFSDQHSAVSCTSQVKCKCGKPHHYLLHFEFRNPPSTAVVEKKDNTPVSKEADVKDGPKDAASRVVYTSTRMQQELEQEMIVLPSAIVRFICGTIGGTIRVLIDNCSQATLISDRLVKRFRLPSHTFEGSSIGGVSPGVVSPNQFVSLSLISRSQIFAMDVNAEVVPPSSMNYELCAALERTDLEKLTKYQLADPAILKKPVRICDVDMIVGAKYVGKCLTGEKMEVNELTLIASVFGWLVSGKLAAKSPTPKKFTGFTLRTIENDMKRYFDSDQAESAQNESQTENDRCVQHFMDTYEIGSDGKFNLRLPLKLEKSKIANNRKLAINSLFRSEKKLEPALKAEYVKFMREYLEMGHMSLASPTSEPHYYIPHRAVVRVESLTTPVRVVFNASSKFKGEVSLNEGLMLGPQIQRELFDMMISVRSYAYVFTADVAKMYRMVWIDARDRDMQRIFWRESVDEPIREYQLNTVTYGTTSASFMATQCLEIIARKIESDHPMAARVIRENFYMDDLIAGSDDLDQVRYLRQVIHNALKAHGFNLRKYCANHASIIADIPSELVVNGIDFEMAENVAMLGVVWSRSNDSFCIKTNLKLEDMDAVFTKRSMLSYLARTFDPLGLVAPVLLRGKLMIQAIWQLGIGWDDPISSEVAQGFSEYLSDVSKLDHFAIPRYCGFPGSEIQLVGFCDASSSAYCAALYIRSLTDGVVRSCRLVCAKTRIAPTKEITIPKLELCSALLLAQLAERVRKNLNINLCDCFMFTDATTVLCWLSQPPDEWRPFVSNRVEKIAKLVPYENWFYVHTRNNPADLATRGLSVAEFLNSSDWFKGPDFLKNSQICSNPIPNLDVSTALERRKKKVFSGFVSCQLDLFIDKFSSFPHLLRVLAYVLRFVNTDRNSKSFVLSAAELDIAQIFALRMVQRFYFFDDIERLSQNRGLKPDSKLLSLSPFLDDRCVLRVGGRLRHSNLSESRKHPVILPAKAKFVRTFVRWVHEKYFHANRRFLQGYLASRYWIVGGSLNLVKSVVHDCVRCARFKGETASQLMGELPPFRVRESRPFAHTGVDLAGPFQCKCVAHRTTRYFKIYIAIFVCMVVKCVHMEIVTDLSSAKFVEALQRFIARRGVPSKMYSDNGTNFIGTKNLIVQNQAAVEAFMASERIGWSTIPPRSPHFGGLWESAVRSAKYHFARVNDGNVLSYDEYSTLVTRVEAVLNSRPLCLSADSTDEVLTPGHFLIGRPLTALAELDEVIDGKSLSRRLAEVGNRLRSFWNIWRLDYLNQLQRRYKWQVVKPNIQVGQVVLLKDDAPPLSWPLAVVEKIHPDESGLVRVVDVRKSGSGSVTRRAITKIILLPVDVNPEPLKGSGGGACLRCTDRCSYFYC